MQRIIPHSPLEEKPVPGWACIFIGVGFLVGVSLSIYLVLRLAG